MANSVRTIPEPNKTIPVVRECDVVVVGGGPGGIGAAVSAARNGADTVLIERYGYLGGMGTGGLVTIIPYRALLPKGVENMLVACRAFSSDQEVNNFFNLIPHCVA